MPLQISRNDIRNLHVDALVDPSDVFLSGSGSIDKMIHELCGEGLKKELESIGRIMPGEAVLTSSYDLKNCRYIIHTCGPIYQDGRRDEKKILASCYENCLKLAKENKISSIGFPLIASGTFGFPKGQALKIATDSITSFLLNEEMDVYLLVYDKESFDTAGKLYTDIKDYLSDMLPVQANYSPSSIHHNIRPKKMKEAVFQEVLYDACEGSTFHKTESRFVPDESFSQCLIRMIDERKMNDPDVYKRANIDRKHFNHIKNTIDYRPKKETAVALAIGMRLNIQETDTLLERAGYLLSRSSKFDLIIRYCIEHQIYDIFQINEILFEEDQKTLGC